MVQVQRSTRKLFTTVLATALLVFSLPSLNGCAALGKVFTPTSAPLIQAGVDVAVSTAIGTNILTQKVKALAIKTIAQQVLAVAQNPTSSIALLEQTLNQKVAALAPNAADQAAFMVLTAALETFLNTKIASLPSNGPLNAETQVAIEDIVQDVIVACSFYGV